MNDNTAEDGDAAADDDDDDNDRDGDRALTHTESGHFAPAVTHDEVLTYLEEHRGASTGELADAFDVSRETIRRKCSDLEQRNEIRAREAGRTTFWQLTMEQDGGN